MRRAFLWWALGSFFLAGAAGGSLLVTGGVSTAEGVPLAGARVELLPMASNLEWNRSVVEKGRIAPEPLAATTTDSAGRFTLAVPGAGIYRLVVGAQGHLAMRYFPLPVVEAVELPPVSLVRDAGIEVEVRAADGAAAAGIWVMATSPDAAFWRPRAANGWRSDARIARSDARGRLRLPRAELEEVELHAFPRGSLVTASTRSRGPRARLVLPPDDGARRTLELRDPEGEPLAEVRVAVGELAWPAGSTDAEGSLALHGRPAEEVALHFFASGGARHRARLAPERGLGGSAEVVWAPPRLLTGRVIDAGSRRGLAGAVVWPGHDPGTAVVTDAQGIYRLPDLGGERFWVQAEAPGRLPSLTWVEAGSTASGRLPTLALEPAKTVAGRAVDARGEPLPGVEVEAWIEAPPHHPRRFRLDRAASRAATDARGRFLLRGLHGEGRYRLIASLPGYADAGFRLEKVPALAEPTLVLWPARPGFGRVVDARERPIADAEVKITTAGDEGSPDPLVVVTGEDGRFAVTELPAARLDLEARREGFAPLRVRGVEIAPGEGAADLGTLVLIAGEQLRGTITDAGGRPLPEVSVWSAEDRGQTRIAPGRWMSARPAAVSDAEGRFRIAGLGAGERRHLLFGREGYLPVTLMGVAVPHAEPLRVTLYPAARIRGRVVDEAGGTVAGAGVRLAPPEPPPGTVGEVADDAQIPQSLSTGDDGTFSFRGVAPGEVELTAEARGFLPSELLHLEVAEGETLEGLEIALRRGAVVEGRVTHGEGVAVAGARLSAGHASAESDADGFYRLEGVAVGPTEVELRHQHYERTVRELEVEPGINFLDVVLETGWEVSGRVTDAAGEAVSSARVELRFDGPWGRREYLAASDDEGVFRFEGVADGRYRALVSAAGYATTESSEEVAVSGAPVSGLELRLERGAVLRGRLLGLSFDEVAAVTVTADALPAGSASADRVATIDYEGRYEIADLGPGDWLVEARLRGGSRQAEARVTVAAGTRELERDLELGGGLTLEGRISTSGEPLAAARVAVAGFEAAVERAMVTGYDGSFRFEGLEAGRYRLSITGAREGISDQRYVDLAHDLELAIEIATARVGGWVVDGHSGEPVASALLYVQALLGAGGSEPGGVTAVTTGADGAFTLARLSAGRHRITAQKAGYTTTEKSFEVAPGEVLEGLELELFATAGLDLLVRVAGGPPPPTAVVAVFDPAGQLVMTEGRYLTPEGRARFVNLPPGSWDALVSAPGAAAVWTRLEIPGEPRELTLPAGSRLRVRVPVLVAENRSGVLSLTSADGRAFESFLASGTLTRRWPLVGGLGELESVPPGVWVLRATDPAGRIWERTIVTAGEREVEVTLE